ncbi:MAG: glycosyl transferase [Armatimonadota bacterium]|nr:MAG: glycosyl transferase [Armatimonadota bacterium]
MSEPSVAIIIVNWNAGRQLRECLDSIASSRRDGWRLEGVVVVDNASGDDSLAGIGEVELPLRVLTNSANRGFAAACNQGAGHCASDYLLFLNPDCVVEPDAIAAVVAFMERKENGAVGVAGARLLDAQGRTWRCCSRRPRPLDFLKKAFGVDALFPRLRTHLMREWDHEESRPVDHVMGSFYLVRRNLFEQLGGFDERFFVYLEDLDFSVRTAQAGYTVHYLAEPRVFHRGGGTSEQARVDRLFYSLRSRVLYAFKHFGRAGAMAVALTTLTWEPLPRLAQATLRANPAGIQETLQAYVRLWSWVLRGAKREWER